MSSGSEGASQRWWRAFATSARSSPRSGGRCARPYELLPRYVVPARCCDEAPRRTRHDSGGSVATWVYISGRYRAFRARIGWLWVPKIENGRVNPTWGTVSPAIAAALGLTTPSWRSAPKRQIGTDASAHANICSDAATKSFQRVGVEHCGSFLISPVRGCGIYI
jgi:hypothetical protein